jgi:acetyl esterase/lipase
MLLVIFASRALLTAQNIQPADLWNQPVADADRKLAYGKDELQFGELRLPKTKGPHPVVVLVHGGCFVDRLPRRDPRDTTFEPLRPLAAALANAGIATWNLEYRRAGNPGGGYPGSFQDLAAGTDFLRTIARANRLDLHRVVMVGHSSGGPLVHWLAARPKLPPSNPLYAKNPLRIKAIVNVDGPPDIAASQPLEMKFCPVPGISQFMGGTVAEQPDRYRDTSALSLLPIGVSQTIVAGGLLRGSYDLVSSYEAAATAKGDSISVVRLEGGGHFDMLRTSQRETTTKERALHSSASGGFGRSGDIWPGSVDRHPLLWRRERVK